MTGPICEYLIQPETSQGNEKASMTSPTAGNPDWQRTNRAGSEHAPILPACTSYFSLETTAATSPSVLLATEVTTYLDVEPMSARSTCSSSGVLRSMALPSFRSRTLKVKPASMAGSEMSPAVLKGSANIL